MGTKTLTHGHDSFRAYKEGWIWKSWRPWTIYGLSGDDAIYGGEKLDSSTGAATNLLSKLKYQDATYLTTG